MNDVEFLKQLERSSQPRSEVAGQIDLVGEVLREIHTAPESTERTWAVAALVGCVGAIISFGLGAQSLKSLDNPLTSFSLAAALEPF